MMEMVNVIIAALFLLVIIYMAAQVFIKPVKLLWKLVINSAVGLVLLLLANYLGTFFEFSLPVNVVSVLLAGFLGIPGVLLLVCLQLLMR